MVSVDKFFVYGGGRWREVDTGSGRIDGWGRAKFLVSRGGKLQATRSRPILSALRKLADKKTSAAKAGLRLSEKITQRHVSRERDARVGCTHCQCCHRINTGSSCSTKPAENKASVAIQCDELEPARDPPPRLQDPFPLLPRDTSKRKRDSTSSDNLFHTKVLTVATVHSPRKPEPKRWRTTSSNKSPKKVGLKRKRQISSSSDESRSLATLKRSQRSPSLKLRRPGPLKRKRRSSTEGTSPILHSKISLEGRRDKPKHKKVRQDETSSDDRLRRTTRQHPSIVISSDESDSEPNLKSRTQSKSRVQQSSSSDKKKPGLRRAQEQSSTDQSKHKVGPTRTREKTSINEPLKHKVGPKKPLEPSSGNRQNKQNSGYTVQGSQQESPKELMIDEQDVHILRLFLQKHYPDEELLRFDTDDKYKMLHFYQINPLVCVERCPRTAAASASYAESKRGQLGLIDFASKLGLRSVSEPSSTKPKRNRTRRREDKSGDGADEPGSEHAGAEDKENMDRLLTRRKRETKMVLRESLKRNKPVVVREYRESETRRGDSTVDSRSANETENVKGVKIANVIEPHSKKAKPKASKRSGHNEYSNLEDHAIVSWVSVGGRACSVNGNRLWRQLQEQFHRITGRGRTWHSLRNRYLRYILPGLESLALPHAQQARLRAAAATGELKARRKQPRRNSIFTLPPRGASSRRRAAPPGDISDEETVREQRKPGAELQDKDNTAGSPPARSLAPRAATSSYSDITRQFAHSQRALEQRSSERSSARSAEAPPPGPRRARRHHSANKPASEISRKQSPSPRRHSSRNSSLSKSNRRNSSRGSSGESLKNKRRRSAMRSPREHTSSDSRSDDSSSIEPSRRRSSRLNSPGEPNRHNSLSEPNRRRSNRHNSPSESNGRKSNRHNSPSESNGRKSNRHNSPNEPNSRKSNRHNSPNEPNRRKSNRHNSSSEPNRRRPKKHNWLSEPNKRKSNRHNSPSEPNRRVLNKTSSPSERKLNRNKSSSESSRNSSPRGSSPGHASPESRRRPPTPSTPDRQLRRRKLFNPATVL